MSDQSAGPSPMDQQIGPALASLGIAQPPQQQPAGQPIPDAAAMPQSAAEALGLHGGPDSADNWQKRYQGLSQRYSQDVDALRKAQDGLDQQVAAIRAELAKVLEAVRGNAPAVVSPQPAPPAAGTSPQPVVPTAATPQPAAAAQPSFPYGNTQDIQQTIARQDAELHKLRIVAEYTQPGQPGYGLPLLTLDANGNIPTVPPVLGADGRLDDSGQRRAIEGLIAAMRSVPAARAQQIAAETAAGLLPGSAPGAPAPVNPVEQRYNRYKELQDIIPKMGDRPSDEQKAIMAEYDRLTTEVGFLDPAFVAPGLNVSDVARQVQDLRREMLVRQK